MKAVVCKELTGPEGLTVETMESPKCGKGKVRIAVHACGVNFPDILMTQGLYQTKPPLPFTPGFEAAGEVIEVGEGCSRLKLGDRVFASTMVGGYADEVVVPEMVCIPMVGNMDYPSAAAMPVVYGTVIHALKQRGNLQAGETLLVLGATGGVGMGAIQLGKIMGAKVIAAGGSDEKLKSATEFGADHVINYNNEDIREAVKKITGGKGANVIFDPVGGDYFDSAVKATAWNSRYLVIGFAAGRIPELAINRLLIKSASLVGVFWGQFAAYEPQTNADNFRQLLQWHAEGKFTVPVGVTYPLEEAAKAMNDLLERKVVGKAILTTGRS